MTEYFRPYIILLSNHERFPLNLKSTMRNGFTNASTMLRLLMILLYESRNQQNIIPIVSRRIKSFFLSPLLNGLLHHNLDFPFHIIENIY